MSYGLVEAGLLNIYKELGTLAFIDEACNPDIREKIIDAQNKVQEARKIATEKKKEVENEYT